MRHPSASIRREIRHPRPYPEGPRDPGAGRCDREVSTRLLPRACGSACRYFVRNNRGTPTAALRDGGDSSVALPGPSATSHSRHLSWVACSGSSTGPRPWATSGPSSSPTTGSSFVENLRPRNLKSSIQQDCQRVMEGIGADGPGQSAGIRSGSGPGVKPKERGGSGSFRTLRMRPWPAISSLRREILPSEAAIVTRCIQSSSLWTLRQCFCGNICRASRAAGAPAPKRRRATQDEHVCFRMPRRRSCAGGRSWRPAGRPGSGAVPSGSRSPL